MWNYHYLHSKNLLKLLLGLSLFSTALPIRCDLPIIASREHQNEADEPLYTLNFHNIPMSELIRFFAKISGRNFIFDEAVLDFPVTIISQEPTTLNSVETMIVQLLTIHGFSLLEEAGNIMVYQSGAIRPLAEVTTEDPSKGPLPVIETRWSAIRYANPASVAALLKPLLSTSAIIEVDPFAQAIILSDLSSNIEQAVKLIALMDRPKGELVTYAAKHGDVVWLAQMAAEISVRLFGNGGVAIIPDPNVNRLFLIVDEMQKKTMLSLLADLDTSEVSKEMTAGRGLQPNNLLIYPLRYKKYDTIKLAIKEVVDKADEEGFSSLGLISMLHHIRYLPSLNALMMLGTPELLLSAQTILKTLDLPSWKEQDGETSHYLLYHSKYLDPDTLVDTLGNIAKSMEKEDLTDLSLLSALKSVQSVGEADSLLVIGDTHAMTEIKALLESIDRAAPAGQEVAPVHPLYFVYKIGQSSYSEIEKGLNEFSKALGDSAQENDLKSAIASMTLIPQSHSIFFHTKSPRTQQLLLEILPTFDVSLDQAVAAETHLPVPTEFLMYSPHFFTSEQLLDGIQNLMDRLKKSGLSNPAFLHTLASAQYDQALNVILFTGDSKSIAQVKLTLATLDREDAKEAVETLRYTPKFVSVATLQQGIDQYMQGLSSDDPITDVLKSRAYLSEGNIFVFKGPSILLGQVDKILSTIDTQANVTEVYIYHPRTMTPAQFVENLHQMAKELQTDNHKDEAISHVLNSALLTPDGRAVLMNVPTHLIVRVKSLLESIDTMATAVEGVKPIDFFVYKLQSLNVETVKKELTSIAEDTDDVSLKECVEHMRYVQVSNSLIFNSADPNTLAKVKHLLSSIDTLTADEHANQQSNFFVFKLEHLDQETVRKELKAIADDTDDTSLKESVDHMRYVELTNSLIFNSNSQNTLSKIKNLLSSVDAIKTTTQSVDNTRFLVYKVQQLNPQKALKYLEELSEEAGDPELKKAIARAKYIPSTNSIVFMSRDEKVLARIKEVLDSLDRDQAEESGATHFMAYKLQSLPEDQAIDYLKELTADTQDSSLKDAVAHVRYAASSHSLIFNSSNEKTLMTIEHLLKSVDEPKPKGDIDHVGNSKFLVYKLQVMDHDKAMEHLQDLANQAGDDDLKESIAHARYIPSTNSLVFIGKEDKTLGKIQSLLQSLDNDQASLQKPSEPSHFVVYRLQSISEQEATQYLGQLASNTNDSELKKAVASVKYVPATHSLVFVSPSEDTLNKIEHLLTQIDEPKPHAQKLGYKIYTTKNLTPEELIAKLSELATTLSERGVLDPTQMRVIGSLSVVGQGILISGPEKAVIEVNDLLTRFDEPGGATAGSKSSIETIDDVSFLIYKVQYHLGGDILQSVSQLAADLTGPASQPLASAIQSLRWIQVTNSLIATGDAKTLAKLHDLIVTIDAPLKQIFIEVLVLESDVEDNLEFGLRWGAQGTFQNRFSFAGANLAPNNTSSGDTSGFATALQAANGSGPPAGSAMPLLTGGSVGVIGDVILHQGQTYFALGPLVNAIKVNSNITIALNQKIITQDNRTSKLFVGDNIPFTGSIVTTAGLTNTTNANLEYRDVGISLQITPRVGENDVISLDIHQEISEEASTGNDNNNLVSTTQINGIRTTKTQMDTRAHVPDRSFLVLSGSIRNTVTRRKAGIPCLGGLPIIGVAFSQNERFVEKRNVIIFVRPFIIKDYDMYREITQDQEDLYRDLANGGETDFDEALNIVECPGP